MESIGAVLLAAGSSSRFGDENKLVADFDGEPLIRHVATVVSESGVDDIVVVTGHDREAVEAALDGLPLRFVHNEDWPSGMGRSIARGIRALRPDTPAAFIIPGDMPFLTVALLQALAGRYADAEGNRIVVPTTEDGRQRNPVLWPRRCFDALASLDGPKGGKALLKRHWSEARLVPVADVSVFTDVDTPDDLPKT